VKTRRRTVGHTSVKLNEKKEAWLVVKTEFCVGLNNVTHSAGVEL